jgi:hypothetical protein
MTSALGFVSSTFADIAAGEPLQRPATAGDNNSTSRRSARSNNAMTSSRPSNDHGGFGNTLTSGPTISVAMSNTSHNYGRPPATPGSQSSLVPELDEKPLGALTPRTAYGNTTHHNPICVHRNFMC